MLDIKNVYRCEGSDSYQFRLEIPAELQNFVGKKEVKRKLDSLDEEAISKVAAEYTAEYEALFQQLCTDRGRTIDAGIISYLLYCLRDQL